MNKERTTLIAVYGTLRKDWGNHRLIADAKFLGEFQTEPVYSLYNLGGFPGLKEGGTTSVTMEVYAVNDEEARWVDQLEGYSPNRTPTFYDKVNIETPYGTAGVYIYVPPVDNRDLIVSGDYTKYRKERMAEYSR